jgi:hypothetical protein
MTVLLKRIFQTEHDFLGIICWKPLARLNQNDFSCEFCGENRFYFWGETVLTAEVA